MWVSLILWIFNQMKFSYDLVYSQGNMLSLHGISLGNGAYLVVLLSELRGAYDKFPDFFRMGTFIYGTHIKL